MYFNYFECFIILVSLIFNLIIIILIFKTAFNLKKCPNCDSYFSKKDNYCNSCGESVKALLNDENNNL